MLVNDVSNLIRVPDELPLDIAATLPCGALASYAAIERVKPFVVEQLERSDNGKLHIVERPCPRHAHTHAQYYAPLVALKERSIRMYYEGTAKSSFLAALLTSLHAVICVVMYSALLLTTTLTSNMLCYH